MEEVKTFVPSEYKQEAKEVVDFLADLNQEEKKGFLMFMQGIKVAKSMEKKTKTAQEEQHDQHDFDNNNSWLGGLQYSFENCNENHKGFFTNERHQANR